MALSLHTKKTPNRGDTIIPQASIPCQGLFCTFFTLFSFLYISFGLFSKKSLLFQNPLLTFAVLMWYNTCVANTEGYRSGYNGPDSKNYPFYHSLIFKTLDFVGVFSRCLALCEMPISQFSRIFQNLIPYSMLTVAAVFIHGEISKWS